MDPEAVERQAHSEDEGEADVEEKAIDYWADKELELEGFKELAKWAIPQGATYLQWHGIEMRISEAAAAGHYQDHVAKLVSSKLRDFGVSDVEQKMKEQQLERRADQLRARRGRHG